MMSVEIYIQKESDTSYNMGRVIEVILNPEHQKEQMLILKTLDETIIYIPYEEITLYQIKPNLTDYIGKLFNFNIKGVMNNQIIGSGKLYQENQQEKLLQMIAKNPNKVFKAHVTVKKKYGVYLSIKGACVFLKNYHYSKKPIRVCDELKVGDQIEVQLTKGLGKKIFAKPICCDETPYILKFDDFKPNQVVLGLVRTLKDDHLFVCIAPGVDAMSPYSPYFDVEEGDLVCFKIHQVREDGFIRGHMARNLTSAI